jgi:hypothetical protein
MADAWPLLIDATRMTFQVAKARTDFLLTIESQGHPSVGIRFPISFGYELAEQLLNMLENAEKAYDPSPKRDPSKN